MTLYHPKTKIHRSVEAPTHSTAGTFQEGTVMIAQMETGLGRVLPSAGSAGEIFAGFAYNYSEVPTTRPMVEVVTIPATSPYDVTLANTPLNPTTDIHVLFPNGSSGVYDTTPDATLDFHNSSGNVLTFHSSDAGLVVTVTYRYTLSVAQAAYEYGDGSQPFVRRPTGVLKKVGLITQGLVYTDMYHTGAAWDDSAIVNIQTGAGGLLVRGGSGAAVNGRVVYLPTADFPYLGLEFVCA